MSDTRFSVAVHVLVMVSESDEALSSSQLAQSAGTNPSYIRKIVALLTRAGILSTSQGRAGAQLSVPKEDLSLLQIYQAVTETHDVHLVDIHQNANDACVVGRFIRPTLTSVFSQAEAAFRESLQAESLADLIERMRDVKQNAEKGGRGK